MKRAAPSEEPQDVSSDDSPSCGSGDESGKGKGRNAFGLPNASKAVVAAEDTNKARPREEPQEVSSDDSLSSDSDDEAGKGKGTNAFRLPNFSKAAATAEASMSKKKKSGGLDFSALSRHGYHGGPSVLTVRPPQEEPNWSWSTGKDRDDKEDAHESYEERERTRAAVTEGEKLIGVHNAQPSQLLDKDKKSASFSQKEKRKRDRGQASRGKNYVEEEKRLLRGSGVYSGFDT
ncbi:uncharacterized protein LOC133927061 isoform X1 [Phragmites australis]|uniref:uncharacterized protein LOC133927061 isoform X1 n=1 Tax=Phragmites australis TaxID=29695 RepID=UPI002D79CA75|nr:uncharacterized protein LOC133927061 isoform X1 [Phragmites australis]